MTKYNYRQIKEVASGLWSAEKRDLFSAGFQLFWNALAQYVWQPAWGGSNHLRDNRMRVIWRRRPGLGCL